jgi:error-prone DNA polymerase
LGIEAKLTKDDAIESANLMTRYVELHAHSYYSLLDGASSPAKLAEQASHLGMPALALTDHDNLYGALVFAEAAAVAGIKPIFGSEMSLEDGSHLTLLVRNEQGWANLCQMISLAQTNAPKGQAALPLSALETYGDGLLCLTGCSQGAVAKTLQTGNGAAAKNVLAHYQDCFGKENIWIELQHHHLPDDSVRNTALIRLAREMRLGTVATNNVHYACHSESRLQDVLVCIRHNLCLDDATPYLRPNSEYRLKSGAELAEYLPMEAIENSLAIAELCQFQLRFGLQDLPDYPSEGNSPQETLRQLCYQSPRFRHPAQLDYELAVIEQAGLSNYFLLVWDVMRYAREQGILAQGRGSAANSLVAYLLGISPIDPVAHELVFERFLSAERPLAPDIDIDFDAARREEVIQYIYERYGTDHAAMACTFVTYRRRSAIRDVGKALGIPAVVLDSLSRGVDWHGASAQERVTETLPQSPLWQQFAELVEAIQGLPRHLGIHNGGMVLMKQPLASRLPTEPAAMQGRVVVQWDKESLEAAGFVKVDILGLRMLSAVSEAAKLAQVDLDKLPFNDPQVFRMVSAADTVGVFQVESRAQMQMLPRFRPKSFHDLIVAISLIRPGPLQGDMVHPYLRRRLGEEPVQYFHPLLKPALRETLGVILFQEQILKVARDLSGFTAAQGELLRRALGKKDATAAIGRFRVQFIEGALAKNVPESIALLVFEKLLGFGSYSFPKSHAAAFAVLVYQSAWLRHYHPAPFFAALLNNQPMGFYTPSVIVNDARRHEIQVLSVDIHLSLSTCTVVDKQSIRLGFQYVRSMGDTAIQRLLTARDERPFRNLTDLVQRSRLPERSIEQLIQAGALDCFGKSRRELIWELGKLRQTMRLDLRDIDEIDLPELTRYDKLRMEYGALGLSTEDHIMALLRSHLEEHEICHSQQVNNAASSALILCAGMKVVIQAPPTAKGFRFITLEDEFGFINVIVRPKVYEQYRRIIRQEEILLVKGMVQRESGVVNVMAEQIRAILS